MTPLEFFPPSFSTWWNRSTRDVKRLADMPGLAASATLGAAGPLFEPAVASFPDHPGHESPP